MHDHNEKVTLENMSEPRPDIDALKKNYADLEKQFANTKTTKERYDVLLKWDEIRSNFQTWANLVSFRFTQDTRNAEAKKEQDYADELSPIVQGLDVNLKRNFLTNGQDIEREVGTHILKLWESDVTGFRDEIQEDTIKEAKRVSDYTELASSAEIPFQGDTYNLSGIQKHVSSPDRETRHAASAALWEFFTNNAESFDKIYDDLVHIRTNKAKKLGFKNFVPLGYLQMQRVDYDSKDVEAFREQILKHVIPLCKKLQELQKERLGVDKIMAWDRNIFDRRGNPTPGDDGEKIVNAGIEMFDRLHPKLGKFFRMMNDRHLLDLETRKGKAGGGYCNSFPDYKVPVVFANFNGTRADVEVITHEIGHAFQYYSSASKVPIDYQWPTYEGAEVHSMSLEFLTWPYMDLFFGDDADRFREIHMIGSLTFLPYGAMVDHFQHLVYENPDISPAERHTYWHELESQYLPGLDWGDLAFPAKGGRWQLQGHIFCSPFYYIDYTLALTCALQFWRWSQKEPKAALEAYVKLCNRGGEAPFQDLVRSAGLTSPFDDGCLEEVVNSCAEWLDL